MAMPVESLEVRRCSIMRELSVGRATYCMCCPQGNLFIATSACQRVLWIPLRISLFISHMALYSPGPPLEAAALADWGSVVAVVCSDTTCEEPVPAPVGVEQTVLTTRRFCHVGRYQLSDPLPLLRGECDRLLHHL